MAQLRWKEVSSETAKKNIEVLEEVVREGNLFVYLQENPFFGGQNKVLKV